MTECTTPRVGVLSTECTNEGGWKGFRPSTMFDLARTGYLATVNPCTCLWTPEYRMWGFCWVWWLTSAGEGPNDPSHTNRCTP